LVLDYRLGPAFSGFAATGFEDIKKLNEISIKLIKKKIQMSFCALG